MKQAHAEQAVGAAGGGALSGQAELHPNHFREIAAIMQSDARIHLSEAKMTLVHSRLNRRLRDKGLTSFTDYLALVKRDPVERRSMVVALTTNHTHFFREAHHFDHLRSHVAPELRDKVRRGEKVRIWSAGCSSGEEVYTIAMTLAGQSRPTASWLSQGDIRLLATDIAPHVVDAVAQGIYADATCASIPEGYRKIWTMPLGSEQRVVTDLLRKLVTPRVLNLFDAWPMRQKYDAIFCRNVMIYFNDEAKAELEERLVDMLVPGGFLYIGHSERLIGPVTRRMKAVGQTIYQHTGEGRA